MDEHDKRFDKLEKAVADGFEKVNGKLDALRDERAQRKGAMGLIKLLLGASGIYGLIDLVKGIWHK